MDLFEIAAIAKRGSNGSSGCSGGTASNNTDLASAIKPVISGKSIHIQDGSDKVLSGMRVFGKTEQKTTTGKNLFDAEKAKDLSNYVTTNDGNYLAFKLNTIAGKTYTFNRNTSIGYDQDELPVARILKQDGTTLEKSLIDRWTSSYNRSIITFVADGEMYFAIAVTDNLVFFDKYFINPQLEEGPTATPYEPYTGGQPSPNPEYPQEMVNAGADGNLEVTISRKNLLDIDNPVFAATNNYDTKYFPKIDNGVFYSAGLTGHYAGNSIMCQTFGHHVVYFSGNNIGSSFNYEIKACNGISEKGLMVEPSRVINGIAAPGKFKIKANIPDGYTYVGMACYASGVYGGVIKDFMVSTEEDTTYEPYHPIQSLTLSTPNGFPGVPVSSDGNYTDESGRQWICDEIDLERGVYVKRVETHIFDGNETIVMETGLSDTTNRFVWNEYSRIAKPDTPVICDIFRYNILGDIRNTIAGGATGTARFFVYVDKEIDTVDKFREIVNGISTQYVLATPIETLLSADEIAAYKALHTNYPTTNIFNDANAHMEVTYTADTQKHIETNYVPKSDYEALENRVAALEQNALSV